MTNRPKGAHPWRKTQARNRSDFNKLPDCLHTHFVKNKITDDYRCSICGKTRQQIAERASE